MLFEDKNAAQMQTIGLSADDTMPFPLPSLPSKLDASECPWGMHTALSDTAARDSTELDDPPAQGAFPNTSCGLYACVFFRIPFSLSLSLSAVACAAPFL
jgi:hypothetical protein